MKLIYRIIIRLSVILCVVLALWATFFYYAIIDEINDEVDDSLEDYSEQIIVRILAGETLSSKSDTPDHQYQLTEVTPEYAQSRPHVTYNDIMAYIPWRDETEPVRNLTTIYKDENGKYYELVVSTPTIEKEDLKEAILCWIIFLYAGLLIVIIFINIWVYQSSNRPLHKLLKWLDNYKIGENNAPLKNDTDITEFQKLNESAIRNMKRAEEVFKEQKQFIGNASHEIQTPLAVCCNRIENLMEDETLSENQLEELVKTHRTLEYIAKLNKSLLLLSKIDNRQFSETSSINFNSLIKKFIQDYEEVYAHKNIHTELIENETFTVGMNDTLAGILVSNLIKNAYVHNTENGQLVIEISSSGLIFKNTGQNSPLDSKHIFERFFQGNKKEGSTGLGLALVKSICDTKNLRLNYHFENNFHCFEILETV